MTYKRKNHCQLASRNTPTRIGASVLARAPDMPNSASFLACTILSGYIWMIMLRLDGMVRTANRALMERRTKNAYWFGIKLMMR